MLAKVRVVKGSGLRRINGYCEVAGLEAINVAFTFVCAHASRIHTLLGARPSADNDGTPIRAAPLYAFGTDIVVAFGAHDCQDDRDSMAAGVALALICKLCPSATLKYDRVAICGGMDLRGEMIPVPEAQAFASKAFSENVDLLILPEKVPNPPATSVRNPQRFSLTCITILYRIMLTWSGTVGLPKCTSGRRSAYGMGARSSMSYASVSQVGKVIHRTDRSTICGTYMAFPSAGWDFGLICPSVLSSRILVIADGQTVPAVIPATWKAAKEVGVAHCVGYFGIDETYNFQVQCARVTPGHKELFLTGNMSKRR